MLKPSPRVELVCIGSELLSGKTSIHGAYLAKQLSALGLTLSRETTVGDDPDEMRRVFAEVWRRADIVISTGGLGPTFDDLTRDVWSRVVGRPLKFFPHLVREIEQKFRKRNLKMPGENKRQAFVLSGARVMDNRLGTAPGQVLVKDNKVLGLFPGPARELAPMVQEFLTIVRPFIGNIPRLSRTWSIFGSPESFVDEKLDPIRRVYKSNKTTEFIWGILAHRALVDVKVAISGTDIAKVRGRLDEIDRLIRQKFKRDIFGTDEESLEDVVGRALKREKATLSVAESCTGGLLAEKITRIAGSSDYFLQGYVTYSNQSKRRLLGVRKTTLERFGAVSETCAREMAQGCRVRSGADYALSITGIAGPAGGTPEKPVGLVYIGLAGPRGTRCRRFTFSGEREQIRERSALTALDLLRRELL